jgi:hypothetical protein
MGLVGRGSPTGAAPDNQIVVATSITIFDQQGVEIGYIESLNYSSNRPVTLAYHLNGSDAGRPIESVSGIEKGTLSATGFALYDKTALDRGGLINRLAGAGAEPFVVLANQQVPFSIRQVEKHPANPALVRKKIFLGCMLTSLTRAVGIGNQLITESVNMTYMWEE